MDERCSSSRLGVETMFKENLQLKSDWKLPHMSPPLRHLHMILEKQSQAHKPACDSVHLEALFWFNQQ